MKVLAINGSPRKNGNTVEILEQVLKGAAAVGAETEMLHLYNLKYRGCLSCLSCKLKDREHGSCAVKDDLSPILEEIKSVDAMVLGTPIYFMNITSCMSAFLERLLFPQTIYSAQTPTVFPKKLPTAICYTMNMRPELMEQFGLQNNLAAYQNFIEALLGVPPKILYSCNTLQFADYTKYETAIFSQEEKALYRRYKFPEICEQARNIGRNLIEAAEELAKS